MTLSLFLPGVPKPGDPGVGMPTSLCRNPRTRRLASGVAYGGGLYDFAASQSKGVDADIEGEVTGETGYTMRVRWGVRTGVVGEACVEAEACCRGEAATLALFVCAKRRRDDMAMYRNAKAVVLDECESRSSGALSTDGEQVEEALKLRQVRRAQIRRVCLVSCDLGADTSRPDVSSVTAGVTPALFSELHADTLSQDWQRHT